MKKSRFKVSKTEYDELYIWYYAFEQANRIKLLANKLQFIVPHEVLDKRVQLAWDKVKEVEPFPTFNNKTLIPKARYILAWLKIQKLWKNSNIFEIV